MSRPKKTLNQSERVQLEALAQYLTLDQLADYFGIARSTLQEIIKREPEVFGIYKKGRSKAISQVAKSLIDKAIAGDTTSAIFFLKTQAGWREVQEIVSHDEQTLKLDVSKCSTQTLVEIMAAMGASADHA